MLLVRLAALAGEAQVVVQPHHITAIQVL